MILLGNFSSVKGTTSIKMREIDPSLLKEPSFICSFVINSIQKAACSFRMFRMHSFEITAIFSQDVDKEGR